jgi:hypothetical protein
MWARLEPSGAIVSQSGGITVEEHPEAGIYFLHFPATVDDKAVTVSGSWTPAQIGKSPAFKAASCGPGGAGCNGDNTTSELFVEATEGSSIRDAGYFVLVTP